MKTLKVFVPFAFLMAWLPMVTMAQQGEVTLEFANAASTMEVVQKYTKALQAGDVGTMNSLFAADAMIYGLGGGLDSLTVAQHKEYYSTSTAKYKHALSQELYLPVKVTNNWNEGEWILSWGINTVTDKETGKTIRIPYHIAATVANGKITNMRYWYDMLNIIESQGYTVSAPTN